MPSAFILFILGLSLFLTSLLSGIFGMAGGMILMGILLALFSVADAMVLHGIAQMASNGSRVALHLRNIQWRIAANYALGAALSLAFFAGLGIVLDKAWVFLSLGAVAFLGVGMPPQIRLNVRRRLDAAICGVAVTALHLIAGVSGSMLDIFFLHSDLNRHQIVATKALTQTGSHLIKIIYFMFLAGSGLSIDFPAWVYALIIGLAFAGAFAGRFILARFSEEGFRSGIKIILCFAGTIYILRGISLLINF